MNRGEITGEKMIPEKGRTFAEAKRDASVAWFWNCRAHPGWIWRFGGGGFVKR